MKEMTFQRAIREALREALLEDERVILFGEDIGVAGGNFGLTKGLLSEFGDQRIRDTPISETAIVGMGVGAAICGLRPVVEIMFADFLPICMDELHHKAAKWRYAHGSLFKVPLVVRTAMGAILGGGPEHSECTEAFFMHSPGLKIVVPSTPYDAKGLLAAAIRDDNPVLFFEHKQLYYKKGMVPEEAYIIPLGKADIKREGQDVTVVATALMVHRALTAAEELGKEDISVEVVDPRTLSPLDDETIIESVHKTGRLVIVEEGYKTGGMGAEIAARVSYRAFDRLQAPIVRVAIPDVPIPFSPNLERYVIPDVKKIIDGIKEIV